MMKERYIALMEKALSAYSDAHIDEYFEKVKRDGLKEHGFARLTSNMGILISHGCRTDLFPRFLAMMDFCCETIPTTKAANDFAVREIVTCIIELDKRGTVDADLINTCKNDLGKIEPYSVYTVIAL